MTKQEAYERIRAHFVADPRYGYRAATALTDASCVYLTDDGAKCAVGCLIPDGNPMQAGQGGVWTLARTYTPEFNALFGTEYDPTKSLAAQMGSGKGLINFLSEIQCDHDTRALNNKPISTFLAELDRTAERHGLQVVSA